MCGRCFSGAIHILHHAAEEAAALEGTSQAALTEALQTPYAGAAATWLCLQQTCNRQPRGLFALEKKSVHVGHCITCSIKWHAYCTQEVCIPIQPSLPYVQDRRDAATYITIGQPEVDVNSVDEVQPPPAAAGGQQKVRFLACCALVLMLQWHGSALLAPTGEAVRWRAQQLRLGGSAPSKSREVIFRRRLLWEQERLAGFWEDGQVSRWARCFPLPFLPASIKGPWDAQCKPCLHLSKSCSTC